MQPRLIDRDELWKLFVEHYWDSFAKDRDLILCHVEAVMRMAEDRQSITPQAFVEAKQERDSGWPD